MTTDTATTEPVDATPPAAKVRRTKTEPVAVKTLCQRFKVDPKRARRALRTAKIRSIADHKGERWLFVPDSPTYNRAAALIKSLAPKA